VPSEQQRLGVVGEQVLDAERAGQAEHDAPDVGVKAGPQVGLVGSGDDGVRGLAGKVQGPADQPGRRIPAAQRVDELGGPEVLMHVDAILLRHLDAAHL